MGGAILISGLGIVILALILLFFKLGERNDKKHFVLQVFFLGFIVAAFVLVGKASLDYNDHCDFVVVNETVVSANVTSFDYDRVCVENTNETANSFYKLTTWFMWIILIYLFVYFAFEVLLWMGVSKKGGERE